MSFTPERFPHNGAVVSWDEKIKKYVILDCNGDEHGFRRDLEEARTVASKLPGDGPYVPPKPPAPAGRAVGAGANLDPIAFAPRSVNRTTAPRPEPSWAQKYIARKDAQQRAAFQRVYGKHLGRR